MFEQDADSLWEAFWPPLSGKGQAALALETKFYESIAGQHKRASYNDHQSII